MQNLSSILRKLITSRLTVKKNSKFERFQILFYVHKQYRIGRNYDFFNNFNIIRNKKATYGQGIVSKKSVDCIAGALPGKLINVTLLIKCPDSCAITKPALTVA